MARFTAIFWSVVVVPDRWRPYNRTRLRDLINLGVTLLCKRQRGQRELLIDIDTLIDQMVREPHGPGSPGGGEFTLSHLRTTPLTGLLGLVDSQTTQQRTRATRAVIP